MTGGIQGTGGRERDRYAWARGERALNGQVRASGTNRNVSLGPGELFLVPRGVEHCPLAEDEAHVLVIEPTGTPNTGNAETAVQQRVI